jgi:predicted ATPase
MYISKFQITNYKSYFDSGEIELKPGFNILTGQNSAGKTALLEALTTQFVGAPHISETTVPHRGAQPEQAASVRITFGIDGPELVELFRGLGGGQRFFPRPRSNCRLPSGRIIDGTPAGMNAALQAISVHQNLPVSVRLDRRPPANDTWYPEGEDFLGIYTMEGPNTNGQHYYFPVQADSNGILSIANSNGAFMAPGNDVRVGLAMLLRQRIYRFWAERFIVGQSAFGTNPKLSPNASNLPEVLNVLDGNTARFQRLNSLMREVLPQVKHISVRPISGTEVQILVWPIDYSTEMDYLAIPLNECGSGVAQVLAILYVVINSEFPQVIIVDEPQSFLHPGAVRKLIEILKRYPQHQYIFATHSPTVITATEPTTVTIVRSTPQGTKLEAINPNDSEDLRTYLSEIGARLSDVFGADNVLWVEGETEEECFPMILKAITKKSLMGTAIVGVKQTGDFSGKDRQKALDLYRKLSQANTLLPPAVGFIFDQECLSAAKKGDLERIGAGLVHFLPRRMYENYLLNARAISALANTTEGFRESDVSEKEVQTALETKRQDIKYFCKGLKEPPAQWENSIDGASVLRDIFSELSENRVSYIKTTHSAALTDWLLEHAPEQLAEVAKMLNDILAH